MFAPAVIHGIYQCMELRHLRYFVAVAEELNFRRAGERLRLAQPALSSQIKSLEDELKLRLLERTTRSVKLTHAGRVLLDEARAVLSAAAQAEQRARGAGQGLVGMGRLRGRRIGDAAPEPATWLLRRFSRRLRQGGCAAARGAVCQRHSNQALVDLGGVRCGAYDRDLRPGQTTGLGVSVPPA